MGDADDSLDLLVRIKSDTAGADTSKAALKGVTEETNKSADANKEHSRSFIHAESSARGFHQLLHKITEESPLLGNALRLAISPVSGAFMAAAYAVSEFKKAADEAERAARETAEKNAEPLANMEGAAEKAADAVYTLVKAYQEWAKHGHKVGDQLEAQNQALTANIAQLYADAAAVKAGAEAHKAAAMVILEADRAAGRISEGGYQAAKQRIEEQEKEKTRGADRKALEEEIKLRQDAASVAVKHAKEADDAAKKAQAAALAGAGTLPRAAELEDQSEKARARAEEAKKKLSGLREARSEAQADFEGKGTAGAQTLLLNWATLFGLLGQSGTSRRYQELGYAEHQENQADKESREQAEFARRSADEAKRLQTAQAQRTEAAETANEDADKRREDARKESEELAKARARLAALNQVSGATAGNEAFTGAMKTPAGQLAFEDVTAAEATARALTDHKQVSSQSQQQLREIASAVAGHQVSLQQAVAMMSAAAKNMGVFTEDVVKLAPVLRDMAAGQKQLQALYRELAGQVQSRNLNAGG